MPSAESAPKPAASDEELPQVTPSMLRRGVQSCRRRLAKEMRGAKRSANKTADMRFAVSNRIEADARLAQAETGVPIATAFVEPADLAAEQRALYLAARNGYLMEFGARAGRAVELEWRVEVPGARVELVGNPGIAIDLDDGTHELRKLHYARRPGASLLDEIDVRVALAQTRQWALDALRIVAVDVIGLRTAQNVADLPADRDAATEWLTMRAAELLARAADGRPRAGSDCQGCAFVAGCSEHAS